MRERYLFERKYIRKDNELKIPSKWEKLIGEDTVKILCKEYKEISSFFSENTQYYEQEAPSNVEYMEILEMYLAGSYKSEIIIENTMKDKLFFTFYIPFFKLARYYSRRKYGDILEKYFSKGIYEELYSALACVATRVLVNEIQFLENKLVGKNANEKYSAYVKMYLSNDEYIEELFQFYPLLLRCILEKICSVVEFYHQLISRWEKNVIEIKKQVRKIIELLEQRIILEPNRPILKTLYDRYMKAEEIISSNEDISKIMISGGCRAYLDAFSDYMNPLLGEMDKAEKMLSNLKK